MVVPHCRHPWFLGTWVEQDLQDFDLQRHGGNYKHQTVEEVERRLKFPTMPLYKHLS